MNRLKKTFVRVPFLLLLISGTLITCNDDFVNTSPLTEVPQADVWKDAGLAEAFVTELYGGLGNGGFDEQMLASLTDEALFTHPGRGINTITESRVNSADRGWVNNTYAWVNMYQRIRAANLALEQLADPQFDNADHTAERLRGEAYFMRAYFYQQLLRYYGGIPLVDRTYQLGEADYTIARSTFDACVNFIVADCNEAATLLNGLTLASGRASYAAALALKARILLYAASDLHDMPTASANAPTIAAFSEPALLGYTEGSRTTRWQAAKDAAKQVVDLNAYAYQMDLALPATADEGTSYYTNVALARSGGERELIFARYFINAKNEGGGWVGRNNGPNGYHNWAGNTPLQNLVDDYPMIDGTPFDWNNPDHAAAPYTNRDPRFYATILHDGAGWKPRTADAQAKDPYNEIQTGQYEVVNSEGNVTTHFGLDTRQSSIEDWNGTRTGYYMHKFIDANPSIVDQNTRQEIPWPVLRYTEAVLNYAEACIELGEADEAKVWLNKIRYRAGMPAITTTGEALRQDYRNERRLELVYEEHRYHDARRWMIAPTTLGAPPAGIIFIEGEIIPGHQSQLQGNVYRHNPEHYHYTYTPLTIDPGIENRLWLDKMYYVPIERDEMNRNDKLVQNPGYD